MNSCRPAAILAVLIAPVCWGQVQLLNETGTGAEPVAGLIEGAPALARDGKLVAVEAGGRFRFEPGGTFADAQTDCDVVYQLVRRLDTTRPQKPSQYFVNVWVTLKPRADATALYVVFGWESAAGLRHVSFRPIVLAQDADRTVSERMEIDDDELEGSLRLHVFRGGQELPQAGTRGSLAPSRVLSLVQSNDLAGLKALDPAGLRQAARGLKAEQVNAVVRLGNVQILDLLIAAGMDLGGRDAQKRTSLFAAVESGRLEAVRRLIQAKVPVEATFWDGSTPLTMASFCGHTEIVSTLLQAGAKPDKINKYDETALSLAAEHGHADIVNLLLDAGAKWPKRPEDRAELLAHALKGGHLELTERLLGTGLDLNRDNHGVMPLVVAVKHSQVPLIAWLLERGADPNAANPGKMTPLMIAAMNDRLDVLHQLIAAGADVDRTMEDGRSALVIAWENDSRKAVGVLERVGASTAPLATSGSAALCLALTRGDIATARRLGELGARLVRNKPAKDSILVAAVAAGLDQVVTDALAGGWTLDEVLLDGWTLAGIAEWYQQESVAAALRAANGGVHPPVKSVAARGARKDDPLITTIRRAPRYPVNLVAEKAEGEATVVAFVNPAGEIVMPKVLKADRPEFGIEAVKAAYGWRFAPSVAKPPVWRRVELPFRFKHPELFHITKYAANQVDQRPVPVTQEPPVVPPELAERKDLALMEVLIDDTGGVYSAKTIAVTDERWKKPVEAAVKRWTYRPGIKADKTVWTKHVVFVMLPEGRSLMAGSLSASLEPVDPATRMPRVKQLLLPKLPDELKQKPLTHIAYVTFDIDREGNAVRVRVVAASSPLLEKNILEAAKTWWFEPAEKGGKILRTPVIAPIILKAPGADPY